MPRKAAGRWRKIAKEAAEQAHRNRIPSVEQPLSWKNLLAAFSGYDAVYFVMKRAWLPAEDVLKPFVEQALSNSAEEASLLLVVGPEGGFTEEDAEPPKMQAPYPLDLADGSFARLPA